MAYSKEKLNAAKAAAGAAGPCVVEEMQAHSKWKAPAYFECRSGVLLWGQLPTVMQGYLATEVDTALGPEPDTIEPGVANNSSYVHHYFRYRAPARKGMWKVEAVHGVGYVCHHVDESAPDLLRRAALVGASDGNLHTTDRDIVCVNRYDWSRWGRPLPGHQLMTELLRPNAMRTYTRRWLLPQVGSSSDNNGSKESRLTYEETLSTNRLMLVDVNGFPQLVQRLRTGFKLGTKNYLFRNNSYNADLGAGTHPFGVDLGVNETEFELGWLAFQNEELVGFVYDGVFCHLERRYFLCGNTKVKVIRDHPIPRFDDESSESDESEEDEDGEESEEREDSDDGCKRYIKRHRG